MTERLHFHFSLSCIGEGNGDPLQCSCLENPRDGGAWWAAVYGAAQSRTRLKWLSSSSSGLHYSSTSVGWLCCTGSGLGGWGSGPKLGSQTHWTSLETLRAVFPNSPLVSTTCCVPSLFLWPSWRAPPVWDAMWHLFNAAPAADTQPGVLMIQPGVLSPRDPQTTNLGGAAREDWCPLESLVDLGSRKKRPHLIQLTLSLALLQPHQSPSVLWSWWAHISQFPLPVKRSTTLWILPRVLSLPLIYGKLKPKDKFIREVRNTETKENSQRRPDNNNVVIKHSQGPLVPFKGL